MTFLVTNPDNKTDGGTFELDGASSVVSADVGGFTYVFVSGGVDDGISVFRLLADGTLTPVFDVTDGGTLELDGARGLSTAMVEGNTYLFAAGFDDNGVSVFRVNTNGTLTSAFDVNDDATFKLAGASDTVTARIGNTTYLYVAGKNDNGISSFRVGGDGALYSVANIADDATLKLGGVDALRTVTVGANTFLIAAGGADNGVSVFQIAANGTLTNTNNVADNGTLNLAGASDVTTAVIGGTTYVFVSGANDNGVSVFSLSNAGVLTSVSNMSDTAATLFAAAGSVSVSVLGQTTYLSVGGNESGFTLLRVESNGALTFMDNVADAGSRELSSAGGVTNVGGATINGATFFLGAGSTDDGVSTFGSAATGQLYFFGQGDPTDARLAYMNNDGGNQTSFVDNSPTVDLVTSFPEEVGVDTAAGFYFAIVNGGNDGSGARLVRGSLAGGAVTTLFTFDGVDNISGNLDDEIVNALHVDVINHKIYIGIQDPEGDGPAATGIFRYDYNPTTGAISNGAFLVTVTSSGKPQESGFSVLDVRDFDVDPNSHLMFFTELLTGGVSANGLFRLDINSPNTILQLVPQAQFPDNGSAGYITDVEVDNTTGIVYFDVESQHAFPNPGYVANQNAIYWISETANGATNATLLTLNGLPGGNHFYPGDMVFDQGTRQLYVESEETDDGSGADTDDVIYVFQLSADGHSATLVNTISLVPPVTNLAANIGGMIFNDIPSLTVVNGTASHAGEQGSAITLLTGSPTITDLDGDHLSSATVQITQGLFSSNESNATDDHLQVTAAGLSGTNITASYNAATGTLTLSGYDTFAHYAQALAAVQYFTTGDNPTNYGLDTTRTFTWTVSDGALNVPGGSQNSATTSITIDAVNDAPVNGLPGAQSVTEDVAKAITGLSVSDPDANPGITDITMTLSVLHGTLTLLTNVVGGITASDVANNGTGAVTITATIDQINATLAAATGLTYASIADYNGSDTLHIVTNDGGNTGSGGALTDTDDVAITISPVADIVNDSTSFAEDSGNFTLAMPNNDTFENSNRAITSVTQGAHGTVTINNNGTPGDNTDDFLVYTQVADYNGSDSFTYTVTSGGVTETGTVNVTITAVADIVADLATTNEDTAVNVLVQGNDTFENAVHSITNITVPAHGTAVLNDNGTAGDTTDDYIVYTPNADYNGSDTFNYTVTSGGVTETTSVSVTINAVADIVADNVSVAEDSGANNLDLLGNDNFESAARFISAVTQGAHGSVAINNNGTPGNTADDFVVYTTTDPNYNGPDTFNYTVTSGGVTETVAVSVTVTAVNDAPVNTVPAAAQGINEDGSRVFSTGNGNAISVADIDVGAGNLTVTLSVLHGTLTLNGTAGLDFTGGAGDGTADATMTFSGTAAAINTALQGLTYNPTADYNGSDTLSITTNDNGNTGTPGALQDVDTVTINIAAVADIVADLATTNEDTAVNVLVQGNDTFENAVHSITNITVPAHGTAVLNDNGTAGDTTDDYIVYTPNADYNGSDTFNYTVTSGGVTETTSVSVTINAVADIVADNVSVAEDSGANNLDLLGNDNFESAARFISAVTQGAHGSVAINNNGTPGNTADDFVVYTTTDPNYNGPDTFNYTVTSGGSTETVAVNVTTTAVNDAPVNTVPGAQTVAEDGTITFTGGNAISIADPDAGAGTLTVTLSMVNGQLTLSGTTGLVFSVGDGTDDTTMTFTGTATDINAALNGLLYETTLNYHGSDTLTITTNDNGNTGTDPGLTDGPSAEEDSDTVAITITAVNDTPVVTVATPLASTEQVFATIDAAATVSDVDLDALNGGSGDYGGATLTVARQGGANADDLFQFAASGSFTVNGANLEAGGLVFASFTNSGGTLTVNFNDSGTIATTALVDAVLEAVQYANNNDTPPASIDLTVSLNDGAPANAGQGSVAGHPATGTATVHVNITDTPENQPPVVDLNGSGSGINDSNIFVEGGGASGIGVDIQITDADAGDNVEKATVTITDPEAGDILTVNLPLPPGISVDTVNSTATTLILIGSASQDAYESALDQVGYSNSGDDPTNHGTNTNRLITVVVNDGTADSAPATMTMTVIGQDDPPVAQPDAVTTDEATVLAGNVLANNGSGADSDVDGPALTVSAVNGSGANVGTQITLASGAHLTVNADGTFSYDPNHAFDSTPTSTSGASNQPGHDSFTYTLNGGGTATVSVTVNGLDSNDLLLGTAGADTLRGGIGNDYLDGGLGADGMYGGVGNDVYFFDNAGDFAIEAVGEGNDIAYTSVSYALTPGSEIEILSAVDNSAASALNLYGNELANQLWGTNGANYLGGGDGNDALIGFGGADTLDGDGGNDYLDGGAGGDALFGGAGQDGLIGGTGNDYLDGGTGADGMYGGDGDDTYFVDNGGDYVAEVVGQGSDIVYTSVNYALAAGSSVEILSAIDNSAASALNLYGNELANQLWGTNGANTLDGGGGDDALIGFGGADMLFGGDGNDYLDGGAGNDGLLGGTGADFMAGGQGSDYLDGGAGIDTMYGGSGDDTYIIDNSADVAFDAAGDGNDIAYTTVSYTLAAGSAIEILSAVDNGAVTPLDLTGNELGNQLWGNAGINVLSGNAGNDALIGFGGADTLAGGDGNDYLDGGAGADKYLFDTNLGPNNIDTVVGFVSGSDKIVLDDAVFASLGLGSLPASAFHIGTAATDEDQRIIYDSATGNLYYDSDGTGGAAQVLFANIAGHPPLAATDFTVI